MAAVSAPIRTAIAIDLRYLRLKRALDVLLTVLLLVPLSVVMLAAAVAIALDSPGNVFFRQRRLGADGKPFEMLKFRSMYVNCDDALHRAAIERFMAGQQLSDDQPGAQFKLSDDPRVTSVGRFIRKTSLDELPQLFNVLRGEMSLVGPRPPLPYEVERYSPRDRLRLAGKPGLTGPWQVYGRSRVTFPEMVEMDIRYLQRQSLTEDLKLIALTLPVVLHGSGGA
jgi:lipopolysaccharide/colanic/teichoic acid biosynthesis glycosyltransferase